MSRAISANPVLYAGFWRRLLALFLDVMLFVILSAPLMYLVIGNSYFYWLAGNELQLAGISALPFVLHKTGFFILLFACWVQMSSSPGKLLTGCRLADADTLQPITLKQALIRLLGYFIAALPLYLGFVWAAFDRKKQGLHDKLAKTVVLYHGDDYARQSLAELQASFFQTNHTRQEPR